MDELNELYQDAIQALMADLETGSHHMNNIQSEAFAKRYPSFMEAFNKIGEWIERNSDENI
jgi:hypothetical protein